MDKVGEFRVKGTAVEDVVNILGRNGYITEVFTRGWGNNNINEVIHLVRVYKEELTIGCTESSDRNA